MPEIKPTINAKLLNEVADIIENHPENYDQSDWLQVDNQFMLNGTDADGVIDCGALCCIAGWLTIAGHGTEWYTTISKGMPMLHSGDFAHEASGYFAHEARVLAGLGEAEADVLFDGQWIPNSLGTTNHYEIEAMPKIEVAKHVAQALRDIASGDSVYDHSAWRSYED